MTLRRERKFFGKLEYGWKSYLFQKVIFIKTYDWKVLRFIRCIALYSQYWKGQFSLNFIGFAPWLRSIFRKKCLKTKIFIFFFCPDEQKHRYRINILEFWNLSPVDNQKKGINHVECRMNSISVWENSHRTVLIIEI